LGLKQFIGRLGEAFCNKNIISAEIWYFAFVLFITIKLFFMHIKFQIDSMVSATNDQGKDYISNHWTKLRDQCFMEFVLSNLVILYTVALSIPVMIG
jgi:hypothetical protein